MNTAARNIVINREEDAAENEQRLIDILGAYGVNLTFVGDADEVSLQLGSGAKRRVLVDDDCGCDASAELFSLLEAEAPHLEIVCRRQCPTCDALFDPDDADIAGECSDCQKICNECGENPCICDDPEDDPF